MTKKAVEKIGIIPRSIIRTFDRFRNQLFPETKKLIIQEFRISRAQFLVSIKCLAILFFIPLSVNYLVKNFMLLPVTENLWNTQQSEIFLNSYQQDYAFQELKKFQEKLYFDYLLDDIDIYTEKKFNEDFIKGLQSPTLTDFEVLLPVPTAMENISSSTAGISNNSEKLFFNKNLVYKSKEKELDKLLLSNINLQTNIQQQIQYKIFELAMSYNYQSIVALTNLAGDCITFLVISLLLIYLKPQIIILKSFLTESIYSLNDTKKSFLLILGTDLLVGFHSPKGWEVCFQLLLRHFGFPENKDFVFLFVASFPVLLDTIFKYWVFRYLNKISPSTVTTYHSMIE